MRDRAEGCDGEASGRAGLCHQLPVQLQLSVAQPPLVTETADPTAREDGRFIFLVLTIIGILQLRKTASKSPGVFEYLILQE
jgi:hypothetical protein